MTDLFKDMSEERPSSANVVRERRRMNLEPSIENAQQVADEALTHPPIGSLAPWAGYADPPNGTWLVCDGRLLSAATYPALFDAIGATWNTGGEGLSEFRIPDMRSRVVVGAGQGSGLTNRPLASKFGEENHLLGITEMPAHAHALSGGNHSHAASGGAHSHTGSTSNVGHSHGGATVGGTGNHEHTEVHVTSLARTPLNLADGNQHDALNSVTSGSASTTGGGGHGHGLSTDSQSHSHSLTADSANAIPSIGASNAVNTIANTGGDGVHNNMQPSVALPYIIRAA